MSATVRGPGGAKRVQVKGRNLVYDAIVEACDPFPWPPEKVGAAEKVIRGLMFAGLEEQTLAATASDATREQLDRLHERGSVELERQCAQRVAYVAGRYREVWPDARLSPTDLAANWTRLA